jgi:hypothetical protein
MFVPKLNEEEARYLALLFLSNAPKGQSNVEQMRDFIRRNRQMGKDDLRPNPTRSNAPYWHQIVQNATDRFVVDHGYVEIILPPPNKLLRITDIGRDYLNPFIGLFERHPTLDASTFFDNTILDDLYFRNRTKLPFRNARQMADFIKSKACAQIIRGDYEGQGFAARLLDGIENKLLTASGPRSEEDAFRLSQIKAWRSARDDFNPIADLADTIARVSSRQTI